MNSARNLRSSGIRYRALVLLAIVSLALVCIAGIIQLMAGAYPMSCASALGGLVDRDVWGHPVIFRNLLLGQDVAELELHNLSVATLIVWNVRLPRVLVAIMVGINLAYSGNILQAITRNELANPYLLGINSGAGLAILVVLVFFPHMGVHLPIIAMLGGAAAFLLVYSIAWDRGTSPVRLVLAGVIVGAIAGSIHTAVFFLIKDLTVVQNAMTWTVGSLTGSSWAQARMIAPWTMLCVVLSLLATRHLDALQLGDATARALGMPVERVRFLLAATAILCAGSAVAAAGLVGFVGLIVPHVVRSIIGSPNRPLLVGCLFAGPALLISADALARLAFNPTQIPVGIVTGMVGGGFFLYLMRRRRNMGKL